MAAVWYVSHICVTKPEARGESKREGNNTEYGGPAGVQSWGKRSFTESQSMGIFNLLVKKREENQKTRSKWYTLKKTQTPQNQGWKVVCSHLTLVPRAGVDGHCGWRTVTVISSPAVAHGKNQIA